MHGARFAATSRYSSRDELLNLHQRCSKLRFICSRICISTTKDSNQMDFPVDNAGSGYADHVDGVDEAASSVVRSIMDTTQ